MHRKIYKYPLRLIVGPQQIDLPAGALVRHFDIDTATGAPAIWAEVMVSDEQPYRTMPREFHIVATGETIPTEYSYHRTLLERQFVWHLFERTL